MKHPLNTIIAHTLSAIFRGYLQLSPFELVMYLLLACKLTADAITLTAWFVLMLGTGLIGACGKAFFEWRG
jgi:uncharacterized membrane protein